jgi:hypothetical protein
VTTIPLAPSSAAAQKEEGFIIESAVNLDTRARTIVGPEAANFRLTIPSFMAMANPGFVTAKTDDRSSSKRD